MLALFKEIFLPKMCKELKYGKGLVEIGKQISSELSQDKNEAVDADPSIGTATVYRMVNLLEEIGAISRKNMYRISCGVNCDREGICIVELDDQSICRLSSGEWYNVFCVLQTKCYFPTQSDLQLQL